MYNYFMEEKVYKEIKNLIKKKFNKNIEKDTILSETGIDSLDLLDLIVDAEDSHNVKITNDELMSIKTIQDVVDAIVSKL